MAQWSHIPGVVRRAAIVWEYNSTASLTTRISPYCHVLLSCAIVLVFYREVNEEFMELEL